MNRIPGTGLYIGDLPSSQQPDTLRQAHITHILSALRPPVNPAGRADGHFKYAAVEIDDVDEEDVLRWFPISNAFLQEGLEGGGGVLVHCANGRSRSATFLIAYLISHHLFSHPLTPNEALNVIRQAQPSAEPNASFMSQLDLYHRMGCPDEPSSHPVYQRWLYQRHLSARLATGLAPSTIRFSDDNRNSTTIASASSASASSSADASRASPKSPSRTIRRFRCRRCRTPLATSTYLVPHDSLNSPAATSRPNLAPAPHPRHEHAPCAHIFLDPLSWMRPELEQGKLDGRLECPKASCCAHVGKYAWQGMRCSCGVWVVPGISLARGRVDEVG